MTDGDDVRETEADGTDVEPEEVPEVVPDTEDGGFAEEDDVTAAAVGEDIPEEGEVPAGEDEQPSREVTLEDIEASYNEMLRKEKDVNALADFLCIVSQALREGRLAPELAGFVEDLYKINFSPSCWSEEDRQRRDAFLPVVKRNPVYASLLTDDGTMVRQLVEAELQNGSYEREKKAGKAEPVEVPKGESPSVTSLRKPDSLVFEGMNF